MPMEDSTKLAFEQSFTKSHQVGLAQADRESAAWGNIAEQSRILFLEEKMKIGPREAMSQQRLDADKLAGAILQQRSAGGQPQAAGGPLPVPPKTP